MESIWMATAGTPPEFAPLNGGIEVDTVVVGGGITGVTTAWMLQAAGQRVALLEADTISARNTGRSTGNLYATLSEGLGPLRKKWDADAVRTVAELRAEAMDRVELAVATFDLECDFARRTLHACVAGSDKQQLQELREDFDATAEAGLAPQWLDSVPALPFPVNRAFAIEGQAQFNPYLYATGLARGLSARGVQVHEHSAAVDVDAGEGLVQTARGSVRAAHIVLATHSPAGFNLVQAEMEAYREYGVSSPLAGATAPAGIFWVRDQKRSIRGYRHGGSEHLVVVGEKHKTGEGDPAADYPGRLDDYAREHFGTGRARQQWSAQQFRSADGLPYIGQSAHDNVFIATGFAADGLTWGTVAAAIVSGLITAREARGSQLLTPRRLTPIKSGRTWAAENATVMKHLVGDRLGDAQPGGLDTVRPGEGRVLELDGDRRAVYRAPDGTLTVLSPVCPHMKCHVAWNPQATSWDCPCHGSRFRPDGSLLEGPAMSPLERIAAT